MTAVEVGEAAQLVVQALACETPAFANDQELRVVRDHQGGRKIGMIEAWRARDGGLIAVVAVVTIVPVVAGFQATVTVAASEVKQERRQELVGVVGVGTVCPGCGRAQHGR